MVYLDVLIQLYSCVQWHFYQTMIVARSSLSAKFPWSMVIYDTSEDIWKMFKIYGYFGNFENFGKFWIFLKILGKKMKILEKNWKFWKKNSKVGGKFRRREGYILLKDISFLHQISFFSILQKYSFANSIHNSYGNLVKNQLLDLHLMYWWTSGQSQIVSGVVNCQSFNTRKNF